jgi:hypothetical protein
MLNEVKRAGTIVASFTILAGHPQFLGLTLDYHANVSLTTH